jgi:hypothetical protein
VYWEVRVHHEREEASVGLDASSCLFRFFAAKESRVKISTLTKEDTTLKITGGHVEERVQQQQQK